ncbi:MAG: hypothetical protein ACFE0I_15580 [Elainellaceae cyanobacterium]
MESIIAWIIGAAIVYGIFKIVQWAIAQQSSSRINIRGLSPNSDHHQTRPNRQLERDLTRMMGGNRKEAERLVNYMRRQHPGQPEDWYWDKAIYDLKRDRRS